VPGARVAFLLRQERRVVHVDDRHYARSVEVAKFFPPLRIFPDPTSARSGECPGRAARRVREPIQVREAAGEFEGAAVDAVAVAEIALRDQLPLPGRRAVAKREVREVNDPNSGGPGHSPESAQNHSDA
jgi:hypothetical protein